ncbi:MAG: HAD family hydrolase [Clostridia bacterium]|nr:HAD family hydrolase [Clostridia bacterium]MBR2926385.1 HAD family hydrolase [Clostridia bacterium]
MKQYTHLIWDFNGTVLDDVAPSFASANRLLRAHGLAPIESLDRYREVFGFPIVDYYQRLGFDFSKTPFEELAPEWVAYYREASTPERAFEHARTVLEWARKAGLCQLILSATEEGMLRQQCTSLGLLDYFSELVALDNIHAGSKVDVGLAWRARNPGARALMIGDSEHDAEVAHAIGADCILVSYGHRPKEALQRTNCLFVADNAQQIISFLEE